MQFVTGCFCVMLVTVAACATPNPPAASSSPAAPAKPAEHGTILAVRPIPAENPQTARILLASLGSAAAGMEAGVEYIIRDQHGATISVVQADIGGLRPGDRVDIRRGEPTRISDPIGVRRIAAGND